MTVAMPTNYMGKIRESWVGGGGERVGYSNTGGKLYCYNKSVDLV